MWCSVVTDVEYERGGYMRKVVKVNCIEGDNESPLSRREKMLTISVRCSAILEIVGDGVYGGNDAKECSIAMIITGLHVLLHRF